MSDFRARSSHSCSARFETLALELESLSERVARSGASELPLCAALLREWRGTFDGELAAFETALRQTPGPQNAPGGQR